MSLRPQGSSPFEACEASTADRSSRFALSWTNLRQQRPSAEVDVGQDRAGELEAVADSGHVVHDRGGRERPRDLDAPVARGELVGGHRRVTGAEVDGAGRDLGDARAAADGGVVDLGVRVVRLPLRDERGDERAPGALQDVLLRACACETGQRECAGGDDPDRLKGGVRLVTVR